MGRGRRLPEDRPGVDEERGAGSRRTENVDNDLMETDVTFGYNTAIEMVRSRQTIRRRKAITGSGDTRMDRPGSPGTPFGGARCDPDPGNTRSKSKGSAARLNTKREKGRVTVSSWWRRAPIPMAVKGVAREKAGACHPVERLGGSATSLPGRSADAWAWREGDGQDPRTRGSPSTFDRCLGSRFGIKALENGKR